MKARKQRQLSKAYREAFNEKKLTEVNKHFQEERKIQVDGARYGNKRKYMAETKVLDRRKERRRLNRKVESE